MNNKVEVKIGQVEVKLEGSEDYIKAELPKVVKSLWDSLPADVIAAAAIPVSQPIPAGQPASKNKMTTSEIIEKIGFKSHSDLVVAACICLEQQGEQQSQNSYTKKDIHYQMKTSSRYTEVIGKTLSTTIARMVNSKKLMRRARGSYALNVDIKNEMEAKL